MKRLKLLGILILVVFIVIQFIPVQFNHGNIMDKSSISKIHQVPKRVQSMLKASCYDCHSNRTVYPWYSRVQPIRLFLEKHIDEGKAELNFDEFGSYSKRRQKNKLKSIIRQIENDEMPLKSYLILHSEAKLSPEERNAIKIWVNQLINDLNN